MLSNTPSLSLIPRVRRTNKICLEHLLNDPANIIEIPEHIRRKIITPDIALDIASHQFSLTCYLPRNIINKDFMQKLWTKRKEITSFDIIFFLKFSPKTFLSREFCHECFSCYPQKEVLAHLPENLVTRSLLKTGLKKNPVLIKDIAPAKLNRKLVIMVIKAIGLKYIAEEFIDRQTSRLGILADPDTAKYAKFRPKILK